jgi:hypothetical protein
MLGQAAFKRIRAGVWKTAPTSSVSLRIMKRRLTLLALSTSLAIPALASARYGSKAGAIIGGQPGTESDIRATIALVDSSTGAQSCTGTLIAPQVVVTAAHCIVSDQGAVGEASSVQVVFGVLDTSEASDEQRVNVSQVIPHPEYLQGEAPIDETGLGKDNDIAVYILESPIDFPTVPVLPPSMVESAMTEGATIIVTGYGTIEDQGEASGVLYTAETTLGKKSEFEFFAGGVGLPDTCPGDSGGPAYLDVDGTIYLIGATSRGRQDSEVGCGDGGVYSTVPAYLDWIVESATSAGVTAPGGSDGADATDGAGDGADATDGASDGADAADGADGATDETDGATDETDGATDETDGATDESDGADVEEGTTATDSEDSASCSSAPGTRPASGAAALFLAAGAALGFLRRRSCRAASR